MRLMIPRSSHSVTAPNYGRQLTPGVAVDLDERLPEGGTLAEQVRPEWFEPLPEPPSKKTSTKPASPAMTETEEDRNG